MAAMPDSPWSVALLEDDPPTRQFLEAGISQHPGLRLAASFALLNDARAWLQTHAVDVLLTDLGLPDGHALTLIRELAVQQPRCLVIVVSVFGDEDNVIACVEAGAVGYIHKDSAPQDIGSTIIDVTQGASPISPMVARKLLARLRQPEAAVPPAMALAPTLLSPREQEVLDLISRGYSYVEIARLGQVSLHTVQSHIRNLYGKLAVHSRGEAVFEASRMGLLDSMKLGP
jgi:DNA-binding NarL/FixJ family response regulator